MKKMPVLFVGHGSPMNVLDKENSFNKNFSLIKIGAKTTIYTKAV